jgi:tetratricopeptide (TPR) repeat protein
LSSTTNEGGPNPSQAPPTPAWQWLQLLGGFGLIFWLFVPKSVGPKPPAEPASRIWVLISLGAVPIIILSKFAWQFLRNFDRGVRRAQKLAQEGDVDGAIADLCEQIEEKGPTQSRVNTLGTFLLMRERWDEAALMFRKAEQIGKANRGVCRANLGFALLSGGKPAEAIPVLEEAARIGPKVLPLTCIIPLHLSLALADLKSWNEAEEQFRRAEDASRGLRGKARAMLNEKLEKCRQKLEQHSREQPKPEGHAEL